jgi:excisionase family DNA binding protein
MTTDHLLDMAEAARRLGTTERHLRQLWQERRITGVKVGCRVRFRECDLDEFVERRVQRALR